MWSSFRAFSFCDLLFFTLFFFFLFVVCMLAHAKLSVVVYIREMKKATELSCRVLPSPFFCFLSFLFVSHSYSQMKSITKKKGKREKAFLLLLLLFSSLVNWTGCVWHRESFLFFFFRGRKEKKKKTRRQQVRKSVQDARGYERTSCYLPKAYVDVCSCFETTQLGRRSEAVYGQRHWASCFFFFLLICSFDLGFVNVSCIHKWRKRQQSFSVQVFRTDFIVLSFFFFSNIVHIVFTRTLCLFFVFSSNAGAFSLAAFTLFFPPDSYSSSFFFFCAYFPFGFFLLIIIIEELFAI